MVHSEMQRFLQGQREEHRDTQEHWENPVLSWEKGVELSVSASSSASPERSEDNTAQSRPGFALNNRAYPGRSRSIARRHYKRHIRSRIKVNIKQNKQKHLLSR